MKQEDDSIQNRLSQIEARLAKVEEALFRSSAELDTIDTFLADADSVPDQGQQECYDSWIRYLNNNPMAVEAHLNIHETAALKASIHARVPSDS